MGLFKSSPTLPQPPLPNLVIHLYSPADKFFRPDDVVTGHIALIPVVPITPHALEVSLFGQSLVWHRTRHSNKNESTRYTHWRDNAPLFEVTEDVLPKQAEKEKPLNALEAGEKYTFPFEFRFPAGTGNSRFGQYKKDMDERWLVTPHNLPPTFLHTNNSGDGTDPDYAKIEYGVKAKLLCPGVGVVQGENLADLTTCAPLLFQPLNPNLQHILSGPTSVIRHPKKFTFQSSVLTGQAPSEISFRQAIHDRFSSRTPTLTFEAALEIPDVLASGAEFRFRASLAVVARSDNATHIPSILFRVLKLELVDFTFVRAPRDAEATTFFDGRHLGNRFEFMPAPDAQFAKNGLEQEHYSERRTALNSVPQVARCEVEGEEKREGEGEEGKEKGLPGYAGEKTEKKKRSVEQAGRGRCEAWFSARVPGFTPPNFKSFAITRVYRVKVKLGVELGGKQFVLEAESHVRDLGSAPAQ